MSDHTPQPQRTTARVPDRASAERIISELGEQGIPAERCRIRPLDGTPGDAAPTSPRATGEKDIDFTESAGKTMGAGWLVGALIGAVVGTIGVSLLFEPPWESGVAAAITLAVAIGVGYIAGGLGFLQAGISRTGETGGEPLTEERGRGEQEADRPPQDEAVEVVVDAGSAAELERARAVFSAHRVDRID